MRQKLVIQASSVITARYQSKDFRIVHVLQLTEEAIHALKPQPARSSRHGFLYLYVF
jgi:hypothetical protein